MHNLKRPILNLGLTLVELFLALAIIAIIWVVATRYYQMVYSSSQVNEAITIVQALRGASAQFAAGRPNYAGISMTNLNASGLLPKDLVSATGPGAATNPWGGNINVASTGTGDAEVQISLTNIPDSACENLKNKFETQAQAVTCTGGTFNVSFA